MRKSSVFQQFRLLLWKNYILKLRRPIATLIELLVPLGIIVILIFVRNLQLKFNMDQCYLREKQMDSMGPIPFVRDFLCTFNSTCYNKAQINWNDTDKNEFQIFLDNITIVYNSLPINNFSLPKLIEWYETNKDEVQRLNSSLFYIINVSAPILHDIKLLQSKNSSEMKEGILGLSTYFCGFEGNDLHLFFDHINITNSSFREPTSTISNTIHDTRPPCQSKLLRFVGHDVFEIIAPLLFGKIFYTPDSNLTRQIVTKANNSFVILDKIRLTSIEWRRHFKDWLHWELTDSSEINQIRTLTELCQYSDNHQLAKFCMTLNQFLQEESIKTAMKTLTEIFSAVESVLSCMELDKFVPIKTAEEIANLKPEDMIKVFAGVVFDESLKYATEANATLLDYTIRIPTNRIDSTKKFKVLDRFWTPGPRRDTLVDMKYYTSGFLMIQESLARAFAAVVAGDDAIATKIGSAIQIMPSPCYVDDRFIKFAANLMPFLLLMAWSSSFSILVRSIVHEKERRLKEFMLVMGLTPLCHWLAWFTVALATAIVPIVLSVVLLKYRQILEFSSPAVVLLLLVSYIVAIIAQIFMLSVFFNKANVAAVAAGLLYFVFYIPFVVLINVQDDVTASVYAATGLFAQVSFCNAINFIAFWEQAKKGAQFGNLFDSTVLNLNFGVGHCIVMLWLDTVLYLLVTWYVEAVFPGQYGVPRPWYFPLTRHYWRPATAITVDESPARDLSGKDLSDEDRASHEPVPANLKVGISIQDLSKTYAGLAAPAVNNLNLNFYKSQITAFLGHNGAGKTTTISMLTGIFPPTSGTAYILGQDIRTDIGAIRQMVGLCPQHNILFDTLTVADHVHFYGLLKGMTMAEIKASLPKIVDDVGLTKKLNIQSKNLSGGMKRKLSVAMAFIGDSQVIFLDEPTAGVDPFARRGIWDLLIKFRGPEKTIVLTTHHMDEADYLSDRIAIISQGQLKCCGSAVFLKKQYGDGYYLILVKSDEAQKEEFRDQERSPSGRHLAQFIRKHIDSAKLISETRTQWTVVLPLDGLRDNGFSDLFRNLDSSLDLLKVSSYGLSDTTLEEVFLKVAEDPSSAMEAQRAPDSTQQSSHRLTSPPSDNDLRRLSVMNVKIDLNSISTLDDDFSDGIDDDDTDCKLQTGLPLIGQQLAALIAKRFHYTRRNVKGLFSELILPILMILLMVTMMKMINPFENEPSMILHPWLMMPKARSSDLSTFYRHESSTDDGGISRQYRTDLGEAGIRCMNRSVFSLPGLPCSSGGGGWSPPPAGNIPLQSPPCDCSTTGYQQCPDPASGGPISSARHMASSDTLRNLTGYNISDYLIKNFDKLAQKQYGGYQFLLVNNFALSCNLIGQFPGWSLLQRTVNESDYPNRTSSTADFLDYFQDFFLDSGLRPNYSRIWVNTDGYISMPVYANIFDNLLLRGSVNRTDRQQNYGIVVRTHPFKYSKEDLLSKITRQMFIEMSLSNFVILALSLIPASFVLFLIEERVCGAKRQQFVSGVSPYVYWLSTIGWDIVKYALSALLIVAVFWAFNYQSYIGTKNIAAFLTILCCYGFAIIPHMYPFSYVIATPSTAFVVLSAYNMFVGSISTVTTFFLDQLQADEPDLKPINDALKRLFLIFPQYGLGRGMMDLSFNYMKYNISNGKLDYDPFEWDIAGKKLLSFGVLFVFWSAIICVIESGIFHRHLLGRIKNYGIRRKEIMLNEDVDVAAERERVKTGSTDEDVLKVIDLTKMYNPALKCSCNFCHKRSQNDSDSERRLLAVNNVCFGVKPGECFGLLGVNGAGKTTTFKMLTGEELITSGDAFINGKSIINNMVSAHKSMGFCPQFDALHALLTCEEELIFYCRIRGIDPTRINATVASSLKSLSLLPHARKTTQTLSGGNKRKLSTAISLIGSPNVVFMDEPTSGMDAGARRFLWNRIQKLTNERKAVVLTSHNMEECEVLCHRLAIMVNGEFQCLGSVQQLKSKFGDDYYVTLRMHSNCDDNGERDRLKSIMGKEFPTGVFLKDENFVTLQYRMDPSTYKLHRIFDFFENLKSTGIILDYSVCQTTLDEIFINFAKREDVSKILSAANIKSVSTRINRKSYINHSFEEDEVQQVLA